MVEGLFRRAAVAVVLMVTLLLPYGRCQSPSRAAAHDCCVRHSAPAASVKASCCTVRSEIPAIVVEQGVVDSNAATLEPLFALADEPAMIRATVAVPAHAQHSPPSGKTVLRI